MAKIYLAGPVVGMGEDQRAQRSAICGKLYADGETVYDPSQLKIPNAWSMPMDTWAQCVYTCDVRELDAADWVVVLDYGRKEGTAGTAWECGYAIAKGKRVVVIRMPGVKERSLMIKCCGVCMDYRDFMDTKFWMLYVENELEKYKNVDNNVVLN